MYVSGRLAIFLCLVVGFRPRFHSVWSRPLCNCLVKKINNHRTDVLTHNCLPPILALCSQARMYEINYIDQQSQDKNRCGQLAVTTDPFDCKYLFIISENADRIDCLYGGEGVCENVGPVVKWDSHYY